MCKFVGLLRFIYHSLHSQLDIALVVVLNMIVVMVVVHYVNISNHSIFTTVGIMRYELIFDTVCHIS